jgi:rhodanese-related sulfurtransferase/glyoxylase-like metal-dependent hydrolase (beta-lactamase superfamily II)
MTFSRLIALVLFLPVPLLAASDEPKIKDAESGSHDSVAAGYQLVNTYEYPGFKVAQFNLPVLSHYSYILFSGSEALIIDPGRDIAVYLDFVKKNNLKAIGVFLTHSHADFVAGHMELAHALGVPVHKGAPADFKYEPLKEGSTLKVGDIQVKFIETPGHTPDSMCAYAYGTKDAEHPAAIFTGDTLFVGSIGRPDLLEGTMTAAALASMSYDSWFNKLAKAGDDAVVFPAHGAGSLCGANLGDQPFSTIGAEKKSNPYVQHRGRGEFIAAVLAGLPEAPQYFKHDAAMNRKGPELVDWSAPPPAEVPADAALTDSAKNYVVDLRPAAEYAAGHIPNSVNIALRGRLETWIGIMVPWGARLVLVGSQSDLAEAVKRLPRVGYHADVITWESWQKAGLPLAKSGTIKPGELNSDLQKGTAPVIVDVRLPNEWAEMRIGATANLPLQHLDELAAKLDPTQPVITVCNSAYRSSMAVGILERHGFKQISSMAGGTEAWVEAGLSTTGSGAVCSIPAAPTAGRSDPRRAVRLPDRMAISELTALIKDLPGTFDLVDIRPPEQFADYAIPGARNADIADVVSNSVFLAGAGPLIVVDRDGTLAMAVAGILSQKTDRPIKALNGGVEAYWENRELRSAVQEVKLTGAPAASKPPTAAPSGLPKPAQPTPPPAKETPKKKSAGC